MIDFVRLRHACHNESRRRLCKMRANVWAIIRVLLSDAPGEGFRNAGNGQGTTEHCLDQVLGQA